MVCPWSSFVVPTACPPLSYSSVPPYPASPTMSGSRQLQLYTQAVQRAIDVGDIGKLIALLIEVGKLLAQIYASSQKVDETTKTQFLSPLVRLISKRAITDPYTHWQVTRLTSDISQMLVYM